MPIVQSSFQTTLSGKLCKALKTVYFSSPTIVYSSRKARDTQSPDWTLYLISTYLAALQFFHKSLVGEMMKSCW